MYNVIWSWSDQPRAFAHIHLGRPSRGQFEVGERNRWKWCTAASQQSGVVQLEENRRTTKEVSRRLQGATRAKGEIFG